MKQGGCCTALAPSGCEPDSLAKPWAQLTEENGRAIIRGQAPLVTVDNSLGFVFPTWYLIIQQEQDEALATVNQLTRISLVGALAALAIAVLVGYQISRQLVRPIENLTQTASNCGGQFAPHGRTLWPPRTAHLGRCVQQHNQPTAPNAGRIGTTGGGAHGRTESARGAIGVD